MTNATGPYAHLAGSLGLAAELGAVQQMLGDWTASADAEFRGVLEFQLGGGSKYFRALTVLSCHRAMHDAELSDDVLLGAVAIEIVHNVTLIVDDILDRSELRRGKPTVRAAYGDVTAHMLSGYMMAETFRLLRHEPFAQQRIAELFKRLSVAENQQWRLRRQPLGLADWRAIASEDTGSMFETCACLGTGNEDLAGFGNCLGVLYHGCDDVADLRGAAALGEGGAEDIRDGILTLPAALAIRDEEAAERFRTSTESDADWLRERFSRELDAAEVELDTIAAEARDEAARFAHRADPALALVAAVRPLSRA